ncbi:dihydrofolate reductase family protein [Providencia rettgeri]|uniref:dihydrofolate reductase family protein n=1 Tax=Providencia rettgeri TaxID=587 RepID=UPI0034E0DE33
MITGHVFIATSLDGYIARKNGDIEWLLQLDLPDENHGYDSFINNIDVIIMGRGTFETVCDFTPWPYQRPVVVLSSTLAAHTVPEHLVGKVRFSNHEPEKVMAMLAAQGYKRVYIDGGQVIQSFLKRGLIHDLIITQIPILLGEGRPLFGPVPQDISLKHLNTKSFQSGFIQSHYEIIK